MVDDREAIIAQALCLWPDRSIDGDRSRDDRGIIGFVNDCLDESRQPRLKAEERAVIVRELGPGT